MMHRTSKGPRAEHRQQERQRVEDSATLARSYPKLKSLTVHLEFVDAEGLTRTTEMKYRVNLEHAKEVLLFACPSAECIGGDFDLTGELARAIARRRAEVIGELCCQGRRKKPSREIVSCRSILRYKLNLEYSRSR
jgi:hypothetical protein